MIFAQQILVGEKMLAALIKSFISGFHIVNLFLIFSGCSSTKIQNVDVYSAPYRSPVKIMENKHEGSLEVQAQFSYNKNTRYSQNLGGHTNVNENRVYVVESVQGENYYIERKEANKFNYQWDNLIWNIPQWQGIVDLEYCFTNHAAIYGGINIASIDDEMYVGKKIGLAFYSSEKNLSFRFSSDAKFQETAYNANYLIVDDWTTNSNQRTVRFFSKSEKTTYFNLNFFIGLNTNAPDWLINFFTGFSWGGQTLFDFSDFSETETYTSFSIGVFKSISGQGRLIFGTRFTSLTGNTTKMHPDDYFIQYDFIIL